MISTVNVLGAILVLGGSAGFFFLEDGLKMAITGAINLDENGPLFSKYIKPPVAPVSTFYLFAIKNRTRLLQGGRPSFVLKGPYRFSTMLVRERVKFSKDKERLAINWGRQLAWDRSSSSDPDEKIWMLNPVVPGVVSAVNTVLKIRIPFWNTVEQLVFIAINSLLDSYNERLIKQVTPREFLDGFKIDLINDFVELAQRFGVSSFLPQTPPDNMFGVIYTQNRTFYDTEVWTGLGRGRKKFAEVSKYRGKGELEMWQGKRCNTISGTNGELFKPFPLAGEQIRIFLAPLCRSFDLDPVGAGLVQTKSGVMALEYEFGRNLFQGARSNPDKKCFCADTRSYDCQYDGLVSMGPCAFDAPLFFARANFRDVDPKISNLIDWGSARSLNGSTDPNWQLPSRQMFRLEPITGGVLEVDISLVATFKVTRQVKMRDLAKVQRLTYMPSFISQDTLSLPYELIWPLYYLQKFHSNHKQIMACMAGIGLGAIVLKSLFGLV